MRAPATNSYAIGDPSRAFAVTAYGCMGSDTFPHEIGHVLGLHHDRGNAPSFEEVPVAFPFSYGYDNIDENFSTIMAINNNWIFYFANPRVSYNGHPTGIANGPGTENSSADTARSLAESMHISLNYRHVAHDQCVQPSPFCTSHGHCSTCLTDSNCPGATEPYCNISHGRCTECLINDHGANQPTTPYCVAGQCVTSSIYAPIVLSAPWVPWRPLAQVLHNFKSMNWRFFYILFALGGLSGLLACRGEIGGLRHTEPDATVPRDASPETDAETPVFVPRKGITAAYFDRTQERLGALADWTMLWWPYNGEYPDDIEVVPMLVHGHGGNRMPAPDVLHSIVTKKNHKYWLVFNECEQAAQCNKTPQEQAAFYHDVIVPTMFGDGTTPGADPEAKLIIGGSDSHQCGLEWLTRFLEHYRATYGEDPPRAGWHFHIYPEVRPDTWSPGDACPQQPWGTWGEPYADITHYRASAARIAKWISDSQLPANDEIWISETGCLAADQCPTRAIHADLPAYTQAILEFYNTDGRWIDRFAWYTDYTTKEDHKQTSILDAETLELTPIGETFVSIDILPVQKDP